MFASSRASGRALRQAGPEGVAIVAIMQGLPLPVTVVAIVQPKPESADQVRAILTRAIGEVHAEEGCLIYSLHESDVCFVLVEQWTDEAALTAHNAGPAVNRMVNALADHITGAPDTIVSRPLPAGDSAKGASSLAA